jgi:hypothetical protein
MLLSARVFSGSLRSVTQLVYLFRGSKEPTAFAYKVLASKVIL